ISLVLAAPRRPGVCRCAPVSLQFERGSGKNRLDIGDLFQRLGLALAIGLLVGLERGWRERNQGEGGRAAGIRTFAIIGLLGGLWGAMTPTLGSVPMATAGLA